MCVSLYSVFVLVCVSIYPHYQSSDVSLSDHWGCFYSDCIDLVPLHAVLKKCEKGQSDLIMRHLVCNFG